MIEITSYLGIKVLYFAIVVFFSYMVETITGFGSTVISVSILSIFSPLNEVLPIIVPLSLILSSSIVYQNRQYIRKDLLKKDIFPFLFLGVIIGGALFYLIPAKELKKPFAIFIIMISIFKLWEFFNSSVEKKMKRWISDLVIVGAGITHGLFASGGPLLVFALSSLKLPKKEFRVTLSTVWLTLNIFMTGYYLSISLITVKYVVQDIMIAPVIPFGLYFGNMIHDKVSERFFYLMVFSLLLVSGVLTLII